jgi:hypothetical protein
LLDTGAVCVIEEGLEECIFANSNEVRQMIEKKDERWKALVPDIVLKQELWK